MKEFNYGHDFTIYLKGLLVGHGFSSPKNNFSRVVGKFTKENFYEISPKNYAETFQELENLAKVFSDDHCDCILAEIDVTVYKLELESPENRVTIRIEFVTK